MREVLIISNGNWTEWSTVQGVIDLKFRARLPLIMNSTTRIPVVN